MAVADEVVVRLRADTDQYIAGVNRAENVFSKRVAEMQREAIAAGAAFSTLGQRGATGITNVGGAAARIKQPLDNLGRSAGMARLQMQNLTFQTQDVIQQMIAGQPPLQLLGQQLFQITQYGGSLNGVMGALKNTVASLFSPLGLATTAFVLLGSAAISYLTEIMSRGGQSNEELEKQAQRIQAIADKWGIALPALKRYADERERLKTLEGVDEATTVEIGKRYEAARTAAADLRLELDQLFSTLVAGGGTQINAANAAFSSLTEALDENKATGADVQAVYDALAALYDQTLNPAVKSAMDTMAAFGDVVRTAAGEAAVLSDEAARFKLVEDAFIQLQNAIDNVRSDSARQELQALYDQAKQGELSIDDVRAALGNLSGVTPDLSAAIGNLRALFEQAVATQNALNNVMGGSGGNPRGRGRGRRPGETGYFGPEGSLTLPSTAPVPTSRPMYEFEALPSAGRGGGGGRGRRSEAEREAEAIAKLIDQLEFELEMVGKTDREKMIETNVRRLAASATGEQKEQVRQLTGALYDQKKAQEEANKVAKEFEDLAKSALTSFISDIRNGVSAAEALENALNKVLDKLIEIGIESLFTGGGSGGILAALFGGFRANGGPVNRGKAYVVGERGPELFMPGQAGSIIPRVPNMSPSSQSGANVTINAPINAPGADPAMLSRVEQSVKELGRNIPKMVDNRVNARQIRNVRA